MGPGPGIHGPFGKERRNGRGVGIPECGLEEIG
jgi:hypothetical protein